MNKRKQQDLADGLSAGFLLGGIVTALSGRDPEGRLFFAWIGASLLIFLFSFLLLGMRMSKEHSVPASSIYPIAASRFRLLPVLLLSAIAIPLLAGIAYDVWKFVSTFTY